MTDDSTPPPSLGEVFAHQRKRARFLRWLVAIAIAVVIGHDAFTSWNAGHVEGSQAQTIAAALTKSQEQTRAEVQLRHIVASQQSTIRNLVTIQNHSHATTISTIDADFAAVAKVLRALVADVDAIDLFIIDSVDGNKVAAERDLRLLASLPAPLP